MSLPKDLRERLDKLIWANGDYREGAQALWSLLSEGGGEFPSKEYEKELASYGIKAAPPWAMARWAWDRAQASAQIRIQELEAKLENQKQTALMVLGEMETREAELEDDVEALEAKLAERTKALEGLYGFFSTRVYWFAPVNRPIFKKLLDEAREALKERG